MPFPSYDEGDIAQFAADDEYYDRVALQLRQPVTEPLVITEQVAELERRCRKYQGLCREILATITLEKNAQWFAGLPSDWRDRVGEWQKRLERLDSVQN
jgi:hypothetical protein